MVSKVKKIIIHICVLSARLGTESRTVAFKADDVTTYELIKVYLYECTKCLKGFFFNFVHLFDPVNTFIGLRPIKERSIKKLTHLRLLALLCTFSFGGDRVWKYGDRQTDIVCVYKFDYILPRNFFVTLNIKINLTLFTSVTLWRLNVTCA